MRTTKRIMPEKEKSPQGVRPIRDNDTPTISQTRRNGHIPQAAIEKFEQEIRGVEHGSVSLIVNIRDGRPSFRIEKTVSFLTGSEVANDHQG